jgi:hypothetical protein
MPTYTQSTDFTGGLPPPAYTEPNTTWIVGAGVKGEAIDDGNLILTNQPGSRLENRGTISAKQATVLFLDANGMAPDGSSALNAAGAIIASEVGTAFGCLGVDGVVVDNRGSISGGGSGMHFHESTNVQLINSGTIFGKLAGVTIASTDGAAVTNSGSISSQQYGLWVLDGAGFRAKVTNSGSLSGNVASILVENGDKLLLNNSGTLGGDILCRSAGQKDKIVNSGTINGEVFLGSGNDTFNGKGGKADAIHGGAGNDRIIGGIDSETFTGGAGRDTFVFAAPLNAVSNVDTITDFSPKQDTIELDNKIFTRLKKEGELAAKYFEVGSKAGDKNDYIVYDKLTGFLGYDSDGTKKGAALIVFAKLQDHLKLKADNFDVI